MLAKGVLGICGFDMPVSARPNGDWLAQWLKDRGCGNLVEKKPDGYKLSPFDVEEIRKCLELPLSDPEKIFLRDLEGKDNGRPWNKVGAPDRLIMLGLIRIDGFRVVVTKYIADERIRYILDM